MNDFIFRNATKLIFGSDTEDAVGAEVKQYTDKVLLHYGGGSIKRTGLYDRVLESLKSENIEVFELGGVKPNPRVTMVREGIELCRRENIGFILAVGGGSVIDSAKAIGIGVPYEEDVWDFYEYKTQPEKMLPLGVVLTIPAAGSESSPSSVVTNEELKLKRGCGAECMRPEFAILNPERTLTLPDYQTACGVSDMLAHTMERYFTPTTNVELTDRICEGIMRTVINQGRKVIRNPQDLDARAEIMLSGTIAHNDSSSMGRVGDWATHGMEHEISALNDVAHGAGLSIMFPAWMKYVYTTDKARFQQFAQRVFDIEPDFNDPDGTILKGIAALEDFYEDLGLPTRLSDIDFDNELIPEMARKATFDGQQEIGEFKKLNRQDVEEIYKLAR